MDESNFREAEQFELFQARSFQRNAVQQSMNAVWNYVAFLELKTIWDQFWHSWDSYFDACKDGDQEAMLSRGAEFDRISAECAKYVSQQWIRLTRIVADGTAKAVLAHEACVETSQLRG
jgi:hypothetical protein